ncbi:hypothetical protein HJB72_28575 [Rhizobium lentis]|uniref:hypothetical protein n=1 Tax=Rhizobium lentis TaxID=1138194 RepID=UPI001C829928|nr:hypothetical protein [Rhizobium lentis]MBX5001881.1 hypothetical protein [Rhizobium lentis]
MATIEIIRHKVSGFASAGGAVPIADGAILGQRSITLTGASQKVSTLDATLVAGDNEVWTVVVAGGPARIAFGPNATAADASLTNGWPLIDGAVKPFSVPKGYTATVING